jgi:HipA-like protein
MLFHGEVVALLTRRKDGKYCFQYLDCFRQKNLAPLPGLPFDKENVSDELFPFFQERIPELSRPEVMEQLRAHSVNEADKLQLLAKLSHRSVTDSYELRFGTAAA